MLLVRYGAEGFLAAGETMDQLGVLLSDPHLVPPSRWELGHRVDLELEAVRAPVEPGKIVGVGRNYVEHVKELGNPMPAEPVIFLKSPGSVIGPRAPIVLPPESGRVEHEGEIGVVLARRLRRASAEDAERAILGVVPANDVTARDLQRKDPSFCRAKSFDSFCPLGPALWVDPPLGALSVVTRVNGQERQRGSVAEMTWGIVELLVYVSRMMTLEAGDLVLTGTPSGVGPLVDGDRVEVEIPGLGTLANPVEAWRQTS